MALREFTDANGMQWSVWEVVVGSEERRRLRDRRHTLRHGRERRRRYGPPLRLSNGASDGWLAFESRWEKKRLRPIPTGWFEMSEAELSELVMRALPAGRVRRLIE